MTTLPSDFARDRDALDARRETLLHDLLDEMARHHRRRKIRRAIAIPAAALAVAATVALSAERGAEAPVAPGPSIAGVGSSGAASDGSEALVAAEASARKAIAVAWVRTDPAVVDRLSVAPRPSRVERLTDEELLATLAGIGRPTGLIRIGNETRLTRAVTDEAWEGPSSRREQPRPGADREARLFAGGKRADTAPTRG